MKFSTARFSLMLVTLAALALSGCARHKPAAEVIYRGKLPESSAPVSTAPMPVEQIEEAAQPSVALPSGQVIMGLLVPLSGPEAAIGAQLRDAALMALYEAIDSAPRLDAAATPKLLVRDSGDSPEKTARAAQELLDAGAQIIFGPLVSQNVEAAGRVTSARNIPLVAFSNNIRIAQPGVFIFGFIPEQQVKRVADYAVAQEVKHYAAIAQQDEYGRMVVRVFSENIAGHGYSVQPVSFFNEGSLPSSPELTRVAYDAAEKGRERRAVFLPVTGEPLSAISLRLMQDIKANNGFLKLIGTGLWDNPQTLNDPGLKGAWFATTSPELSYEFNDRFYNQYNYAPSRIASLAYDAVWMIAQEGIHQGAASVNTRSLMRKEGYDTPANGAVHFGADGVVDRALAVVEVGGRGFAVIDAPKFSDE